MRRKEGLLALPGCAHFHIKDVKRRADGWYFVTPGTGDIDYRRVLSGLAGYPGLPISIEIRFGSTVARMPCGASAATVPLAEIEETVRAGLDYVRDGLPDAGTA